MALNNIDVLYMVGVGLGYVSMNRRVAMDCRDIGVGGGYGVGVLGIGMGNDCIYVRHD
jgi:hypothetical protein